jgi:basic amino acid/polyamine antiporter, APA family
VGTTIGSGILRTPGEVAAQLGSASLVLSVWILGGLYALLCCSSVTELATMIPNSGGFYAYTHRAFGPRIGFVVGCLNAVVESVAMAYLSVALGDFAAGLFPRLAGHVQLIGVTALVLLTLLNWIGLRAGSRAQEFTSAAKALGLLGLVVACFLSPSASSGAVFLSPSIAHRNLFLGLIVALQGVVVTYDGWYAPIYFAEEDQNPSRNLPRSIIGTALACTAIYLLMNGAFLHTLGMGRLAGTRLPAADAALLVFGQYGRQFILLLSMVGVLSTINAGLMLTPRILFSMARDGLLPHNITTVNRGGTPTAGLLLCSFASIILVLSGTFESLIAIAAILFVANYLPVFAALLVLRKKEPDAPRPYKVWLYPWTTISVLLASAAFLAGSVVGDLRHSLFTLILILLSYVAALLITRRRSVRVLL